MENIIISCESCCDLDNALIKENNISVTNMCYYVNGEEYGRQKDMQNKEFYDVMRKGATTSTSQINEFEATEYFEELLKSGKDILHISLSSGLSGTFNSANAAANAINESGKFSGKVKVVDSLCACGGIGLLVLESCKLAKKAKNLDDLYNSVETLKHNICHAFTVSDLKYLHRGGRVSKSSYIIGNMLNIKPVLKVDSFGKLVPVTKVIGRKKSITTLADIFKGSFKNASQNVLICHADCNEDAMLLSSKVKEATGITPKILNLGFVIGSHSGPETLALFYVGESIR